MYSIMTESMSVCVVNIVNQLCFKIILVLYCIILYVLYCESVRLGFKIILVVYSNEVNTGIIL